MVHCRGLSRAGGRRGDRPGLSRDRPSRVSPGFLLAAVSYRQPISARLAAYGAVRQSPGRILFGQLAARRGSGDGEF